jgi:hypothetical protein
VYFCRSTRLRPESRQLGSQDHPKANPALHAFEPSIPTAIQSVVPLQHADAASHPIRQRCPSLNQRDLCNFLRSLLLVLRFGTATRVTPIP